MKFDYVIEPESKAEKDLIDSVAQARDTAQSQGMSSESIETVLLLFAMRLGGNNVSEQKPPQTYECPSCGGPLEDVEAQGIGESLISIPCGCQIAMDELSNDALATFFDWESD